MGICALSDRDVVQQILSALSSKEDEDASSQMVALEVCCVELRGIPGEFGCLS